MSFILNIGGVLAFFLSIILFSKKNKSLSDKLLAVWLCVIALHLFSYLIYSQGYWETYPHLIGITVPFPLLHGPFLYLYVLYSLRDQKHLSKLDYLHFLPAVLVYLYMMPFYFGYSAEKKVMVDKGLIDDYGTFSAFLVILFLLSGLTYVVITYRKLQNYDDIIDENFSTHNNIKLNWLRVAILSFLGMFVSAAIIITLKSMLNLQFPFDPDLIFYSFIVIFVVYIGYSGIRQQNLFSEGDLEKSELVETKSETEYKNSGLKSEVAEAKHKELLDLMETEKPFLIPKLMLSDLSKKLDISSNHLSQIINQYEGSNFHDFVNKYRVNEFIERVKNDPNVKFLAHALDSGFNSKSSFNNVFKKIKNVTPSQYIENLN